MALSNSIETRVPSYGTLADEPPQAESLGWMERGRVSSLLQDLVVKYGAHLGILFYMWAAVSFGGIPLDSHFSCKLGPANKVIQTHIGSAICEHSKTYVWSFPQVAIASMVLLIGRDLAQKRFYYCLLKKNGVMRFRPCPLHRDSVILANLWVFGHFWICVGLVLLRLYVKGADPHIAIHEAAKAAAAAAANPNDHHVEYDADLLANSGDPHGLQLLIKLLAWLGMPGLLVIVRLFSAYNLENTLVPLSEYVSESRVASLHNEEPCSSDHLEDTEAHAGCLKSVNLMSGKAGTIGNLVCVKDNCMRALLQLHLDRVLEEEGCADEEHYTKVLNLYWKEAWYKLCKEPSNVELLDGLWPAPFVLATPFTLTTGEQDWSFPTIWTLYRNIGGTVCGLMIFTHVVTIIRDIIRIFAEHACSGFAVVGECISMYFIGLVCHRIYFAHAPTERLSTEQTHRSTDEETDDLKPKQHKRIRFQDETAAQKPVSV